MTIINTQRKVRVSEKLYKGFPAPVAAEVRRFINSFDTTGWGGKKVSTVTLYTVDALHAFSLAEGHKILGIRSDGVTASIEVVAGHNVGAANLSNRIGSEFHMPADSYLVTVELFLGQYYADVFQVEDDSLKLAETINADKGMTVIF